MNIPEQSEDHDLLILGNGTGTKLLAWLYASEPSTLVRHQTIRNPARAIHGIAL